MNTQRVLLFLSSAILLALSSCNNPENCIRGQGSIVRQDLIVDDFDQIRFEVAGNVYVVQDSIHKVEIETNSNIIPFINTSVLNDEWNIRFLNCVNNYDRFDVYISTPELDALDLAGSGNIVVEGEFRPDQFLATLSGSGNITVNVESSITTAEIRGSGNIFLTGSTETTNAFISGSGNISAFDLEANNCSATISGSGNCEVNAEETLTVFISGSGSVRYIGDPVVSSEISGSGSVVKVD